MGFLNVLFFNFVTISRSTMQTDKFTSSNDQNRLKKKKCLKILIVSVNLHPSYAPASIDRGHFVLPVSVCPSVCLSAAENLTCELNIFLQLPYYSSYNAHIRYMQVAFDNTQLVRVIIIKVQVEYQGYISQKMFRGNWCFTNTSCFFVYLKIYPFILTGVSIQSWVSITHRRSSKKSHFR